MHRYEKFSEEHLLLKLREGDNDAFTEIYNRYWEEIANTAYQRLRSREDAEEVVQEIFVNLYFKRNDLPDVKSLVAYLKTSLKFKIIDAFRTQQLHHKYLNCVLNESSLSDDSSHENLFSKELQKSITEVINRLPIKCREVFIKSRFQHLPHKDIAEDMGISVSTVKKHLYKALEILRRELSKSHSDLLLFVIFILSQRK